MAKAKSKPARKPRKLSPKTTKPSPGDQRIVVIAQRPAGVRVNEDTALTVGAYWACIRYISETLAGLPFDHLQKQSDGGRAGLSDSNLDWILNKQANPETPAFQFRETIVAHALNWGNGYAEIERDMLGRPVWLWQIAPDRVTPYREDDGRLYYEVYNPRGEPTYLEAENMFHLRGLGFDGLVGYSVARMAARSIGASIALQEYVASFFANDSTPGGILQTPHKLDERAVENLKRTWNEQHAGPRNRRRVAVLEQDLKWQQVAADNQTAQLQELITASPTEVARWFRVPPHKIGDLTRATFSNIEQQAIEAVSDCLMPWARRLESEANIKLFGRNNRGTQFTKLDFRALLRGDTAARSAFYVAMLDRAVFDIDEVRAWEDLNPIGPDGRKRFVQANMQLLEKAGEEPPPGAAPPQQDAPPDGKDNADSPPADESMSANQLRPVIVDAWRRIIGREKSCTESARREDDWLARLKAGQSTYVKSTLAPIVAMTGFDGAAIVQEYLHGIAGDPAVDWDKLSEQYARKFMEGMSGQHGT